MNIYIIHQYGEPEHFRALNELKNKAHGSLNLFFADFRCMDDLYNGLKKGDAKKLRKGICSFFNFIRSILDKNGVIIYGLAPGSKEISFIERHYSERNLFIYFTSAAEWDWTNPKFKNIGNTLKRQWEHMLRKSNVVHVNRLSAAFLQSAHNCKSITIIPHSIETGIYNTLNRNHSHSCVLHVLYIGRIVAEKGIRDYLWCAKQLIGKPIQFHCIGDGDKELVKKIRSAPNMKYYGHIADKQRISEIMQHMDILVLPSYKTLSWEEVFGMVIIEAMACGVVPVATDCIGPRCIIENRVNGVLIPQKDRDALLREIRAFSENQELLAPMQKACLASASEYAIEKMADRWSSVLALLDIVIP